MEILAAIMALTSLREPSNVQVFSNSQYVIKSMNGRWGSKTNSDLWGSSKCRLIHDVCWHWVKGHDGNKANERADELSTLASPAPAEAREAFESKWRARKVGIPKEGRSEHSSVSIEGEERLGGRETKSVGAY